MFFTILGVLSSVIFFLGDVPYFLDTLKKKTQPHRVTWGIIFLLNSIGFANQYAAGARNSLWLFGAAVLATGAIFIASLWNGTGGSSRFDVVSLIISLFGVSLWVVFDDPLLSILANLFAASVALAPTFMKSINDPESETPSAFIFGGISSLLAAISVGELDAVLLLAPIYSTVTQAALVYILIFKK